MYSNCVNKINYLEKQVELYKKEFSLVQSKKKLLENELIKECMENKVISNPLDVPTFKILQEEYNQKELKLKHYKYLLKLIQENPEIEY